MVPIDYEFDPRGKVEAVRERFRELLAYCDEMSKRVRTLAGEFELRTAGFAAANARTEVQVISEVSHGSDELLDVQEAAPDLYVRFSSLEQRLGSLLGIEQYGMGDFLDELVDAMGRGNSRL